MTIRKTLDNIINKVYGFRFSGWGMKSIHEPPWQNNDTFCYDNKMAKNMTFSRDDGVTINNIDELLWRHYILNQFTLFALAHSSGEFVECGSCCGISAYFIACTNPYTEIHLYDAWEPMINGNYANTPIEIIKQNLKEFPNIIYHKGRIPESFSDSENPTKISFLHIDLNDEIATLEALKYFYPRLDNGGVIVFDDYLWIGFKETKKVIDRFIKPFGNVIPIPTGQGVFIK